jgi:hypothetical protein
MLPFGANTFAKMRPPFKTNLLPIFLLVAALIPGCSYFQNSNENAKPAEVVSVSDSNSALPFSTAEPDNFQADILITFSDGEETSEQKSFVAKNGIERFTTLSADDETSISLLELGADQRFVLSKTTKSYAQISGVSALNSIEESPFDFLTNELLSAKSSATFEKLGTQNSQTKFRVNFIGAEESTSFAYIYYDENLKLPLRQEFFSDANSPASYTFELQNVKLETDPNLFEIPSDYRKISFEEFSRINFPEKSE